MDLSHLPIMMNVQSEVLLSACADGSMFSNVVYIIMQSAARNANSLWCLTDYDGRRSSRALSETAVDTTKTSYGAVTGQLGVSCDYSRHLQVLSLCAYTSLAYTIFRCRRLTPHSVLSIRQRPDRGLENNSQPRLDGFQALFEE
jgi:hypothetical protein